jgi:branched-chain amino acid transport system permease protein
MGFIAFYAVGAYLAALLASHLLDVFPLLNSWFPDGLHTSWLVIIPLAALVAGCGIVLGADAEAARRLPGHCHSRFW